MKKILILTLLMFSAVAMMAIDPAQYLPAKSGLVIYADGLRLANEIARMDTSKVPAEAQEKFGEFNEVLKKHSVVLPQIFNGSLFLACDDDDVEDCVMFFNTAIPETSMQALVLDILNLSDLQLKSEIARSGKHVIYTFAPVRSPEAGEDKDLFCFTYLTNDVVMVFSTEAKDIEKVEKTIKKLGNNALVGKLDRSQLVSVLCDVRVMEDNPEKIQNIGFTDFAVNLNISGKDNKAVDLSATFNCIGKEQLQQLGMQINMMVPMMLGMAFGNDPSISGDLLKNLKVAPNGNVLNISLKIPEDLSKRIETYCANPANFQPSAQQVPGDNAPGATVPATTAPAAAPATK